jgi:hypothetical protein
MVFLSTLKRSWGVTHRSVFAFGYRKLTQRIIVEEIVMGLFMVFRYRSFSQRSPFASRRLVGDLRWCATFDDHTHYHVGDIFLRNTAAFLAVFADARKNRIHMDIMLPLTSSNSQ